MGMTSKERFACALARKAGDQIPVCISPWGRTVERWRSEGHIGAEEDVAEHFGQDQCQGGWLNSTADLDFVPVILEETEVTILRLDGNGASLRQSKINESTPEHVDFKVKERTAWEEQIKPYLVEVDRRRIPFDNYIAAKKIGEEQQRYFCWGGVAPFEQMHPVCGHEYMLMGMAEDPEWVLDMVMTFARFTINHLEVLFAEAGKPDGFFFYEDMGFKFRPFMSPAMYKEIMFPGHKLLFDFAHSHGCPVIVHSCGYVEPLLPGLIEAGMDCLQAMEVKAGMDLVKLHQQFGEQIAFFGGLDVRALIDNDRPWIDLELAKMRTVIEHGGGYILHTDHSEPPEIDYETMRYFVDRGREISREVFAAVVK